ncbi:MAG: hypothetical protein M1481_05670 [Candidatus Thermoplasmatota archaeon]|jgi:hypothetical protein|nr:hypothetical protein [Candidatus Thermoplasmatota archaeon]MCL5963309.1 hypothetical protein [Candidatus Thermoplasmatota archaeon]
MIKRRKRKHGVTGFFEELPTAVIVIVSITIFMIAMIHTLSVYISFQKYNNLLNAANNFESSVRTYDLLVVNGTYNGSLISGEFNMSKLVSFENNVYSTEVITKDLQPPGNFFINITDKVTNVSWTFGDKLTYTNNLITVVTLTTPVDIQIKNNVIDVGVMEIYVWQTSSQV